MDQMLYNPHSYYKMVLINYKKCLGGYVLITGIQYIDCPFRKFYIVDIKLIIVVRRWY